MIANKESRKRRSETKYLGWLAWSPFRTYLAFFALLGCSIFILYNLALTIIYGSINIFEQSSLVFGFEAVFMVMLIVLAVERLVDLIRQWVRTAREKQLAEAQQGGWVK